MKNPHNSYEDDVARLVMERRDGWQEAIKTQPWIKFPADWEIQVIPPSMMAMVRFRVKLPSGAEKSVYADYHNKLGHMRGPYWEVYPLQGDVGRCDISDVPRLLEMIADESPGPV